jgi:hypothetical protein
MTRTLLAVTFAFAAGCGTDGGTPGGDDTGGVCTLGQSQACTCTSGGQGTQLCDDTGNYGACGMCAPVDPDPAKANFKAEIVPIFERSCGAGSSACHARNQYAANQPMDCRGWLSLENAALGSVFYAGDMQGQPTGCPDLSLYDRLMTIDPWECAVGSTYIRAGDPARSYVMNKIDGAPLCSEGGAPSVQMPPADSTYRLSATDKALIQQWITEGALDN